jgi:hypothetical protein
MANTVIAIRSSGVTGNTPSLGVLANGELSLNFADGILYYKSAANTLGSIRTAQPSGLNQEIQFNDSGSFGGNSAFTFNKSIATLNVTNINATSIVTGSGAGGIIAGANVIYSNTFVANTGGYFQFADGTQQTTNAATFAYSTSAFAQANTANTRAYLTALKTGDTFTGAVTVTANLTAANVTSQTYIQFGDGTRQYTANAGPGGGGSGTVDWGFGQIYTSNNSTYANAASANDKVTFVGESGTYVFANATTKTITVAGTPGAQGLTVDYGYVYDAIYYSIDYGTL